jgi:hypothetical protein
MLLVAYHCQRSEIHEQILQRCSKQKTKLNLQLGFPKESNHPFALAQKDM